MNGDENQQNLHRMLQERDSPEGKAEAILNNARLEDHNNMRAKGRQNLSETAQINSLVKMFFKAAQQKFSSHDSSHFLSWDILTENDTTILKRLNPEDVDNARRREKQDRKDAHAVDYLIAADKNHYIRCDDMVAILYQQVRDVAELLNNLNSPHLIALNDNGNHKFDFSFTFATHQKHWLFSKQKIISHATVSDRNLLWGSPGQRGEISIYRQDAPSTHAKFLSPHFEQARRDIFNLIAEEMPNKTWKLLADNAPFLDANYAQIGHE